MKKLWVGIFCVVLVVALFLGFFNNHPKGHFSVVGRSRIAGKHFAGLLKNGKVLLVGRHFTGEDGKSNEVGSATGVIGRLELINPDDWHSQLLTPTNHTFELENGFILKFHPFETKIVNLKTNKVTTLTESQNTVENLKKTISASRDLDIPISKAHYSGHEQITKLSDGRYLLTTGWETRWDLFFKFPPSIITGCLDYQDGAELYSLQEKKFFRTGRLNVSRHHHQATALFDGTVLITGGIDNDACDSNEYLEIKTSKMELYTPERTK